MSQKAVSPIHCGQVGVRSWAHTNHGIAVSQQDSESVRLQRNGQRHGFRLVRRCVEGTKAGHLLVSGRPHGSEGGPVAGRYPNQELICSVVPTET